MWLFASTSAGDSLNIVPLMYRISPIAMKVAIRTKIEKIPMKLIYFKQIIGSKASKIYIAYSLLWPHSSA